MNLATDPPKKQLAVVKKATSAPDEYNHLKLRLNYNLYREKTCEPLETALSLLG
ncbi:MAG: hypothetical protein M3M96_01585 [Candidatus Eremiobacteraeota bacterium]|nr:hypothetical protein [Candidatus Eremiobacteraeota bacterium]